MRFFAMPSFYDGRIRINLAGRERLGKVPLAEYDAACVEAEELVRACRDSITGEPVVDYVERCAGADARGLDPRRPISCSCGRAEPSPSTIRARPYRARTAATSGRAHRSFRSRVRRRR
jgi:hypothetical protein